MAEDSSGRPVGAVLVIGAGVAGIRAAIDLAVVGYEVLLTDESPAVCELLPRLPRAPANQACGLCDLLLPEQERRLARYFCMRSGLFAFADRIRIAPRAQIAAWSADQHFVVQVPDLTSGRADDRGVDAVIVAGSGLVDPLAKRSLERVIGRASAAPAPQLDAALAGGGAQGPRDGLFVCGAAAGADEVAAALTSGSAAAGQASRHLHRHGLGHASSIDRVSPTLNGEPLRTIPVVSQALVVGGSVAGMRVALSLAERGIEVQLVERSASLGGWPPAVDATTRALAAAVDRSDHVSVRLEAEVVQASGTVGRFLTVIRQRSGQDELPLPHGATILATDTGSPSVATDGPGYDNVALARLFAVEHTPDGQLQQAVRWKPSDFLREGIYLARALPDDAGLLEAEAAAQRAFRYLSKDVITTARVLSQVDRDLCAHCHLCLSMCPNDARRLHDDGAEVLVVERVCEGCGICAANCPAEASHLVGDADPQTMRMIDDTLENLPQLLLP